MARLGTILIERGLVTPDQLDQALRIQERRGGRLGPILATIAGLDQGRIDALWIEHRITAPLAAAVDRACGNAFGTAPDKGIEYASVVRQETFVENMLGGCELVRAATTISGQAVLRLGSLRSLPIVFEFDPATGFVVLDTNSENIVRRWVARMQKLAETSRGTVAPGFHDAVSKALGKG